ncbi:MAG TPA: SprT-like domain-containing protein [Pseudolysinimonas sp.]|nr:SprT-like domain-containing protein [Pseudolysinimonas sp.]
MADLDRVRRWADALIALHLDPSWTFGFDRARTRAGLCSYDRKHISVSRLLAERYDDDEIHQVLLHEVAHAMAGPKAGHGPMWKATAAELGYEGKRLHGGAIADELAPWVGHCPAGHVHYRYRRPTRIVACAICSKRFDERFRVEWRERPVRSPREGANPRGASMPSAGVPR